MHAQGDQSGLDVKKAFHERLRGYVMRFSSVPRIEMLLVLLLVLFFLAPLVLTVFVWAADHGGFMRTWTQAIVGGAKATAPEPVVASFENIRRARCQQALANSFDTGFAGREWIVRCTEEAYLRLFHTTAASIVFGRRNSTYINDSSFDFVSEYCVQRQPPDTLQPIVEGLRRWRDYCLRRGVGFAIVITPSKASIYPEDLPAEWRRRYDPRPRNYDEFVRLLNQASLPYIDGHALTLNAKAQAPAPVFPDGGTHWSQYASLISANALLRELQSQGQPVRPIENTKTTVSYNPVGEDADMLDLARLLVHWTYPTMKVTFPPVPSVESQRPSLVMIGGSFLNSLGRNLFAAEEFSEIHWLRYYLADKEIATPAGWWVVAQHPKRADVSQELFAAQCVVLEINEQQLIDPLHLRLLFDDTFPRLLTPDTAPRVFPYEAFLSRQWGEPVRFTTDAPTTKPGVLSGFSGPEGVGRWSDGSEAIVRLCVPPTDQDITLTCDARAVLVAGRLPVQRVTVFANDQPVAEWAYDALGTHRQEATIPRKLLVDGRLFLRFRFSGTVSPADMGNAGDTRQLALFFEQLALRQPYRQVDGPVLAASSRVLTSSPVYAAHFSGAEPTGLWTEGPEATIRLPAPLSDVEDAVLSAEVGAALDPKLLPVQHADIFVNGRAVGEWVFNSQEVQKREVSIPRALFKAGSLEVQFRFAGTLSPSQTGAGADGRRLALLFRSVQLHWFVPVAEPATTPVVYRQVDGPVLAASSRVLTSSPVYAAHFSGAEPTGLWTEGPEATIRLPAPLSDVEDAVLSAEVGAALDPKLLPVQHADIFVNGRAVGEWVFNSQEVQKREVSIPRALFKAGSLEVQFRFAGTLSPSQTGAGADGRRLALLFRSVQLHWFVPVAEPATTPVGS